MVKANANLIKSLTNAWWFKSEVIVLENHAVSSDQNESDWFFFPLIEQLCYMVPDWYELNS